MFFTDCWTVLGISRTCDQQLIKSAYRQLVKKHHPDLGRNPEDIRKRTLKLVAINSAYQRALKEAILLTDQVIPSIASSTRFDWVSFLGGVAGCIMMVLFVFGLVILIDWAASRPATDPIGLLTGLIATIAGGLIFGVILGFVDMIIGCLTFSLSEMIGLEKYEKKIAWFVIVIAHTAALAIFFPQMEFGSSNKHMPPAFGVIFLMIVFYLYPFWFFLSWVFTYFRFMRLKNSKALLFPTEKE